MVAPMLTDLALAPLRAIDAAGLTHRARKWTVIAVEQPGAVYAETPTLGAAIPARLNPLSTDELLRADQPSANGEFWLSVSSGTAIKAGERWEVSGKTGEEDWIRTVIVSSVDFPRSHELRRRARVSGVEANP